MARTRFSVATCNLFNLNRPRLPMYRDPDGWSQEAYDHKIEWTADQMRRVDVKFRQPCVPVAHRPGKIDDRGVISR